MRKIAVLTGTRAEYGLLYWIIKAIHKNPELELQLIATGAHLSPEFGMTIKEIEKDGFPVAEKVEMLLSSDTEGAIAISMGIGMIGFAKAYERLRPDILLVLGDRFEILSAVSAAVPFKIPVAHIHGGESTEGAMDEQFRHAITKMSHIHFPAASVYADRIIQMGENPDSVFCFGAPGLDNIHKLQLLNKAQLSRELGLPNKMPWGIVTYHPPTLEETSIKVQIKELLSAVEKFSGICWVFTMPNADTGSRTIINALKDYSQRRPDNTRLYSSLGQKRYLSLLKYADIMLGNSSSGIIEAPSFRLPVVNIGDRQKGRLRAENIIDVSECKKDKIVIAIKRAVAKGFRDSLRGLKNPYGNGDASKRIVDVLKKISLAKAVKKQFCERRLL